MDGWKHLHFWIREESGQTPAESRDPQMTGNVVERARKDSRFHLSPHADGRILRPVDKTTPRCQCHGTGYICKRAAPKPDVCCCCCCCCSDGSTHGHARGGRHPRGSNALFVSSIYCIDYGFNYRIVHDRIYTHVRSRALHALKKTLADGLSAGARVNHSV